ncbi:S8 family peptidase [Flavobacterium foetidum]|uniref:S8 family peptidase n=1 Tax=Flavobacterium foetidum TaxID=2026681 RepID=UPI0010755E2E|nr:S8 family peptidase [Flavobacterium foetidum]KAF2514898.1 S8 family serine peptidase [Flavobacterium foetidum]
MRSIFLCFFAVFLSIGCKSKRDLNAPNFKNVSTKTELSPSELKNWYQKDYILDGIPGISVDKWYNKNKKKPKNTVIVAIIDTQIDINHEDLQGQLWKNLKEIPDNNIDDDQNGYVDDVNGWSFTGTKNGGYVVWNNYEYVRIIREWGPLFKDKDENEIAVQDLAQYKEYVRAEQMFKSKERYYKNWHKSLVHNIAVFPLVKDTLKHFFPNEDYTYKQLDSMYKKYKINDKTYKQRRDSNDRDLGALIDYMMGNFEVNEKTLKDITDKKIQLDSVLLKNLNVQYDERLLIGDNPNILEKGYGNNNISNNKAGHRPIQDHCTKMAGIIGANRTNKIGVEGMVQNVKIMPLNISPSGDEHDKDIAMAVRYAVDNGAKVINMSLGKEFSMHKDWIFEAFKYAERHNVLIVHSAGNSSSDIDINPVYPNDIAYDGTSEVCGNFINVGSTTNKLNQFLVSDFSNYGKKNVDLFAPGEDIYTAASGNTYKFDSGTSMATPMVSATASLIWTYYPKLTVQQVKQIILDSGTAYNLEVLVPGTKDKKVPFSELSKSGKVLNVYNAMSLAEKVNQEKK